MDDENEKLKKRIRDLEEANRILDEKCADLRELVSSHEYAVRTLQGRIDRMIFIGEGRE